MIVIYHCRTCNRCRTVDLNLSLTFVVCMVHQSGRLYRNSVYLCLNEYFRVSLLQKSINTVPLFDILFFFPAADLC